VLVATVPAAATRLTRTDSAGCHRESSASKWHKHQLKLVREQFFLFEKLIPLKVFWDLASRSSLTTSSIFICELESGIIHTTKIHEVLHATIKLGFIFLHDKYRFTI